MSKGGSSGGSGSSSSGSSNGSGSSSSSGSASSTATRAAQNYTSRGKYDAPANTLSSADVRQRESDALSNLVAKNNIANQAITNRESQTAQLAERLEANRFARNRNEANNSLGRSTEGGSTTTITGNDQSRERERQFQEQSRERERERQFQLLMQKRQLNNQIALNAATRYQNDLSSGMQFSNQANSELRQGRNAREIATIDANSRVAAAGLQAQGNVLGSLFGSLGGNAGSQNYRYWG